MVNKMIGQCDISLNKLVNKWLVSVTSV
jgi:hypothetical protein